MKKYILLLAILGAALGIAPAIQAADPARTCRAVNVPVGTSEAVPKNQTVSGTLCTPKTPTKTIDIMVSGATYNRSYWDWPQNPGLYSYVNKTLQAGRATLTFDRLGTGQSSRMPGGGLSQTIATDAYVLHQLVSWVRANGYARVHAIGHSLGSITVTKEAALYKDIDKIVVTGILHFPGIGLNAPNFATSLYPAPLDPAFIGKGYGLAYLTTMHGRRGSTFYDLRTADPNVIAYDEAHKDVVTSGELTTAILELENPALLNSTKNITAPVLLVMGQTDNIFCNFTVNCMSPANIKANEQPYYASAARFDVAAIPGTAHNIALHPSAEQSFQAINSWLVR